MLFSGKMRFAMLGARLRSVSHLLWFATIRHCSHYSPLFTTIRDYSHFSLFPIRVFQTPVCLSIGRVHATASVAVWRPNKKHWFTARSWKIQDIWKGFWKLQKVARHFLVYKSTWTKCIRQVICSCWDGIHQSTVEQLFSCFTALNRYENKHEKASILTSSSLKYCGVRNNFLPFLIASNGWKSSPIRCTVPKEVSFTVSSGLSRQLPRAPSRPSRLPRSSQPGQRLVLTRCIIVYGVSEWSLVNWFFGLRAIFGSSARANERVHVHTCNVRDFSQPKHHLDRHLNW